MTLKFTQHEIMQDMQKAGFKVPGRRQVEKALEASMEPLPTIQAKNNVQAKAVSLAHVLNLVWAPLIEYMESCAGEKPPEWTTALSRHHAALLVEIAGTVLAADEPLDIDEWLEHTKKTLARYLSVQVSTKTILAVFGPVVPFHADPTPANSLHLLMSGLCSKIVGPAMAQQLRRLILAEIAEVPVVLTPEKALADKIRQDLVDSLGIQADPEPELEGIQEMPLKKSRTKESLESSMAMKTKQALHAVKNGLPVWKQGDVVSSSVSLVSCAVDARDRENLDKACGNLFKDEAVRHHTLILDGAMDRFLADEIMELREAGTLAGAALVTDESPPSMPRFRGLRFQVTALYFGTFLDLSVWQQSPEPQILATSILCDICHSPGKKGVDVQRILEKQLGRLGLNCYDVCSGTGDGGGENEGQHGVHAYFENLSPGYVRRRCLSHIAWRTCDVAIRVSSLSYKNLVSYLTDGITWFRLRQIAITPRDLGGL